jgi:outer membrane protein TolC
VALLRTELERLTGRAPLNGVVLKVNAPPHDVGFEAAWEIVLFGGTRSRVKAADAIVESSVDEVHDTRLTLRAEVARNYLELRDAQTRLRVTRENMASRRQVAAPIPSGGRIRSQIEAAEARREEALAGFEQTVLFALEEVEANLVSYRKAEQTSKGLVVLVENEQDKLALAAERHRRGLTGFVDVLEAQRSLQESQISLARAQGKVGRSFVALNKAL